MTRIVYLQLAIIWTVAHFETKAQKLEKESDGSVYVRKIFEETLVKMIQNHDRAICITWSTL